MKISRLEFVLLLLTAACLAFFAGWFLGGQSDAGTVRIAAQHSPEPPAAASPPASQTPAPSETGPAETEAQAAAPSSSAPEQSGLVNINTAGSEELQTLPGIGEKRAEAIIAYREEHGPFRIVEDLTDVSGIGEGILSQIIDYITVE
ncbi:ComEA family DNA-binding protein [uncultured Pseudoflavonifractor sp.]|uniref:ComEA family DNA-binding protein n=1 Tax=uncultured Pseudoflavonifractor sp. TaxID=1221379 RepID=UPI0025D5AC46|nr:ComEA family DNA-binding protein [uncultured Pseudoflavonifractor sp.]